MDFDVVVDQEPGLTRVAVQGEAGVGRLLSLMQVLALDSRTWPQVPVLVDLGPFRASLGETEQTAFASAAARAFPGRRVAIVAAIGAMREADGVRVFTDEAQARDWLQQQP